MIINGFGGDGRVQGTGELIQTVSGTVTLSYTLNAVTGFMTNTNGGVQTSSGEGTSATFNIDVPSPASFYGLGYSAIQYSSSLETSSVTSGNVGIRANSSSSDQVIAANVKYGTLCAFSLQIFSGIHWLIGIGNTVYTASEIANSYSRYSCHLTSFSSLSWTKYSWCTKSGTGTLDSITSTAGQGSDAEDVYVYEGGNRQGECYWRKINSSTVTNSWSVSPKLYMYSGCPVSDSSIYTSTIGSSRGGMYFCSSVSGYNSSGTAVTLTPTAPPAFSFKVYIYGIN